MSKAFPSGPDRSTLAAEFVLGLLEGDELAEARALVFSDASFASEVNRWLAVTDDWFDRVDSVQPDGEVWKRIEARVGIPRPVPSAEATPSSSPWKSVAMLSMAASLVLAIMLGLVLSSRGTEFVQSPQRPEAAAVSQISGSDGNPLLSAVYHSDSATLRLRVADFGSEGKAPELWLISGDGQPKSLGMLRSDSVTITVSPEVRALLEKQATLAITLEPIEGAPHTAPSGAIIGTAKLQTL